MGSGYVKRYVKIVRLWGCSKVCSRVLNERQIGTELGWVITLPYCQDPIRHLGMKTDR